MITAVVLAAGRSERFGANKLLQPWAGKTIIRNTVETVLQSKVEVVTVVTGYQSEHVRSALADLPIHIVDNPLFSSGLSSSLRFGVKSLPPDCAGALIVLGDMPLLSATLIDHVLACFAPDSGRAVCVPVCGGVRGHPVLWARRFFGELQSLQGDTGAKPVMELHPDLVYEIEVDDPAIHSDIDTTDDFNRLCP